MKTEFLKELSSSLRTHHSRVFRPIHSITQRAAQRPPFGFFFQEIGFGKRTAAKTYRNKDGGIGFCARGAQATAGTTQQSTRGGASSSSTRTADVPAW